MRLIRQGTGLQGLLDEIAADERRAQRLRRALDQASDDTTTAPAPKGTLPGDKRRLRGIPVVGVNIDGASPGTRPDRNLT